MSNEHTRLQVADLAAQFMQEQGLRDYQLAKQKAADQLGVKVQPSNAEVTARLTERQRLFAADETAELLILAKQTAEQVATFLADFKPRLADNLLDEQFAPNDTIMLHCQADHVDELTMLLLENSIDFALHDKRFRFSNGEIAALPVLHAVANNIDMRIVAFTRKEWPNSPISARTGLPMARKKLRQTVL